MRPFTFAALRAGTLTPLLIALLMGGCGDRPDKLVASARQHFDRQDYKGAIIELKNALTAKPDDPEARYLLGTALLEINDLASAEKELRKAAELGYPEEKVAPSMAKALLRQGQSQLVVTEFASVHLTDPVAESQLRTVVGDALLSVGRLSDAADSYTQALAAQPDFALARVGQARVLAAKRDFAGAQKIVDEVLSKSPAQFEALTLDAELAHAQHRSDKAISDYRKAIDAQPDSRASRFSLAMTVLEQGRIEEAEKEIEAMKKLAPRDPRTLYLESVLALQKGKYAQARDLGLELLKVAPDHPLALRVTGLSEFFLGNDQQATYQLEKALQLTPRDLYIRRVLITSLAREGDLTRARRALDEARAIAPKDPGLLVLSGEIALAEKNLEGATDDYQQAMAEGVKSPAVSARLGQLYIAAGDTAEGIKILENGSAATADQIQSDFLLAEYYLRQGKVDEALPWIEQIEKKRPNSPVGFTLRGTADLALKDEVAARKSFESALQARPNYSPALMALARLDLQANNPEASNKRFQAVLEREPGNEAIALAYLSFLQAQNAPAQKRRALLTRLIQNQPRSINGRVALMAAQVDAGELQNAVTTAQEGLATDPENPILLRAAGAAQLASGNSAQAVATFAKLAKLQPSSPIPQVLLAYADVKANDDQHALEALDRALTLKPDYLPAQIAAAQINLRLKNVDAALEIARSIQRQRSKSADGYLIEANILRNQKRWAEADRVLKRGLEHGSWSTLAINRHGLLLQSGQAQKAKEFANEWLAANPKDASFRVYLAQAAQSAGEYAEAAKQYERALTLAPNDAVVLNNLAWSAGKNRDPKALEYAERANKLAPNTPEIMDTLGGLLAEKGELVRATELLRKAVELAPQADAIRLNLAKALLRSGDKQGARKELDQLAKRGTQFAGQTEVQALLKSL